MSSFLVDESRRQQSQKGNHLRLLGVSFTPEVSCMSALHQSLSSNHCTHNSLGVPVGGGSHLTPPGHHVWQKGRPRACAGLLKPSLAAVEGAAKCLSAPGLKISPTTNERKHELARIHRQSMRRAKCMKIRNSAGTPCRLKHRQICAQNE